MSGLEQLLAGFETHSGSLPKVNPPEAVSVMKAQTAPEVAGEPEPEPTPEPPPAPTAKPAAVQEAETKPRKKRTAAVVQKELDDAHAEIFQLKAKAAASAGGAPSEELDALKAEIAQLKASQGESGGVTNEVGALSDALIALGFEPTLRRIH